MHLLNASEARRRANSRLGRREILTGFAAAGAAALLGDAPALAQGGASGTSDTKRIDIHHHFASPAWQAMTVAKRTEGYQFWQSYSPQKSIEDMDRGGVAMSMLSVTTPGIWFGVASETRRWARELNDFGAKLRSDYPGRFGLFAVLPFPDANACLAEIAYAFDTLKADGVGLLTSYSNKWLGDPSFAEVFRELDRRKAIVYVHAQVADCCQGLVPGVSETTIEYNTDTARTIVSLIESGRALECPDAKFIFSHAGGTILALTGRYLGLQASAASLAGRADPKSKLGQLRRLHYDTAGSANPIQMTALKSLVSASQILFGTDFPFHKSGDIIEGLKDCPFDEAELRGINRLNALTLLPKYA